MLVTRFGVGQNAPGRRDNGDAQAIAHDRQFLRTGINTTAGLRHPRNVLNRRLPLEILEFDAHALVLAQLFLRSEEHTSELQSLMRISYAVFCFKQTTATNYH